MRSLNRLEGRVKLTRQQQLALCSFEGSAEGEMGSAGACWNEGVRPWPTMDNLVEKGLAVLVEWYDEYEGYLYKLTALGAVEREKALDARAGGRLL